jgi:hypothetical protein
MMQVQSAYNSIWPIFLPNRQEIKAENHFLDINFPYLSRNPSSEPN